MPANLLIRLKDSSKAGAMSSGERSILSIPGALPPFGNFADTSLIIISNGDNRLFIFFCAFLNKATSCDATCCVITDSSAPALLTHAVDFAVRGALTGATPLKIDLSRSRKLSSSCISSNILSN